MILLSVIGFLLLTWIVCFKIRRRRFVKMINQFNGPPTVPFFGNSFSFMKSATEIYQMFIENNKNYKHQPYRVWLFHKAYIVIHCLKDARIIPKMEQKDETYTFICDIIGDGLLTSSGEKWKKSRVIMEPSFSTRMLNEHTLRVFNAKNEDLLRELKEANRDTYFNLRPCVYRTAIFALYQTIMGFDVKEIDETFEQFLENKDRCMNVIVKRIFSLWLHPEICFKAYLYATGQKNVFDECRNFFVKAIRNKKFLRKCSKNSVENDAQKKKAIIDVLLDTCRFSDEELTDEILTLLFAGTETMVSTTCFTLIMLALNPDMQRMAYDEIYHVFGDSARLPDASDLSRLTFLEQCVKETLRKFTIVPTILRKATADTELADGRVIPAGAYVYLSLHGLHHDADVFPNPEVWNPRNFDPDKVASRPAHSFLPFGLGPRMCLGYKHALLSIKATLTMIIKNFELTTNQTSLTLDYILVTKSREGYFLKLNSRQRLNKTTD